MGDSGMLEPEMNGRGLYGNGHMEEGNGERLPEGVAFFSVPPGRTTDITGWGAADVLVWADAILVGDNKEQMLDALREASIDGPQLASFASPARHLHDFGFAPELERQLARLIHEARNVIGAHNEFILAMQAIIENHPAPPARARYQEHPRLARPRPILPNLPHQFENVPEFALVVPERHNWVVPTWDQRSVWTWARSCLMVDEAQDVEQTLGVISQTHVDGLTLLAILSPHNPARHQGWIAQINEDHVALLAVHLKRAMNHYSRQVFLMQAEILDGLMGN